MDTKASLVGERLRNGFWFTPALMLAGTTVLAFLTVAIDDNADPEKVAWLKPIVYSGGPDGAREVLGVIAASMIGVAGVVFSITIVSLQLASGQFGPRMLANFVRDRGNQVTLGTFISAFLYSLLTLRTLRSDPTSVPHLSVTVALAFAIAGLSVLVYYIHHVAVTIQAPTLIETITGTCARPWTRSSPTSTASTRPPRRTGRSCRTASTTTHAGSGRGAPGTST